MTNTAIQTYQQFSSEQQEMLAQPLNADLIKHRPGARGMLKYITGQSAIKAANRIFGPGRWGYKVISRGHEIIEDEKKGKMEFYTCDIELQVSGAAYTFPGDGVGIVTAPFTVEMHEKARKEATTDALKRALRHYGDQMGLCLYNEDDYVDAGDGTMIQVKDVKPNGQHSQRLVVDAEPARPQNAPVARHNGQQTAQGNGKPQQQHTRLNSLFAKGKSAGIYGDVKGFAEWCKGLLTLGQVPDVRTLTDSQLDEVEAAIFQIAQENGRD